MNAPQPPRIIRQQGFNRTFPLIEEDTDDDDKENQSPNIPNTVTSRFGLKRNNKKIKSQKQLIAGRVRTIYTGPRGGKYYIKNKKKVYI